MNPNDIFWLAKYAHNALSPLMGSMDADLRIELVFGGKYPGIDIWVHANDNTVITALAYQTGVTTWQQAEAFALSLQPAKVLAA